MRKHDRVPARGGRAQVPEEGGHAQMHGVSPGGPAEAPDADEQQRSRAVILAELRECCERHVADPEQLAWLKDNFRNVWPRPKRQLKMPDEEFE